MRTKSDPRPDPTTRFPDTTYRLRSGTPCGTAEPRARCDPTDTEPYFKTRPVLIIERLSAATASRDMLEKRVAYQSLGSLREYVLVAQDKPEIRVYRRAESGWDLETCAQHDLLRLESVGLDRPVTDVFEAVWR